MINKFTATFGIDVTEQKKVSTLQLFAGVLALNTFWLFTSLLVVLLTN